MATEAIVAARTMDAVQRLNKARGELQGLLGIEYQDAPVTTRDAAVARAQQLENVAGFIEAVNVRLESVKGLKAQAPKEDAKAAETPTKEPEKAAAKPKSK